MLKDEKKEKSNFDYFCICNAIYVYNIHLFTEKSNFVLLKAGVAAAAVAASSIAIIIIVIMMFLSTI